MRAPSEEGVGHGVWMGQFAFGRGGHLLSLGIGRPLEGQEDPKISKHQKHRK